MLRPVLLLAAFKLALGEEWWPMPDGFLYHNDCIHQTIDALVADSPVCPHGRREASSKSATYYSDWSVYAQQTTKAAREFSSTWTVPPAPITGGPVGLGSVYIFNGLEDGAGVHGAASYILQPVLQYGKSGCVMDPLLWHEWHLTAYYVSQAGRAYCGTRLRVKEGESVVGSMRLLSEQDSGGATTQDWLVEATRTATGEVSSYTAKGVPPPDSAYLTLEMMLVYRCSDYPTSGEVAFANNTIVQAGRPTSWTPEVRHSECEQAVRVDDQGQVHLTWNPRPDTLDA